MDSIRATPYEYELLGLLADKLKKAQDYATSAYGEFGVDVNPALNLLGIPAVQQTMERVAYGEPLTTGRGMTTQIRPEVAEAALTLLPVAGKAAQVAERGAMAAGRAGERLAERVVPQIMERGGMPAGLLEGMSSRTVSPLTVYHGSPAKFERFDPTKIGSGEGAQAYGYGHYVAEAPGVAKEYQEVLASPRNQAMAKRGVYIEPSPAGDNTWRVAKPSEIGKSRGQTGDATQGITDYRFNSPASAIKYAKRQGLLSAEEKPILTEIASEGAYRPVRSAAEMEDRAYNQLIASDPGHFYEIDLPDEQIAKMLDYDKPLSKQAPEVKKALENIGFKVDEKKLGEYEDALLNQLLNDVPATPLPKRPMDWTGEQIMREIERNPSRYFPSVMEGRELTGAMIDPRVGASELMKRQGIPGIRYLDQGSRGTGEGTSNFVVFPGNEGLLTIQKRNNEVIAPTSLLETAPKAVEPAQSLLDYRGSHTAPGPDFGAPLHDLTGGGQMYPADVYSPKAAQYYGAGYPKADKEAFDLAKRVKGNPDAEVTMYRAVPNNKDITDINTGDWVTLSKDYAKTHGESVLGDYKIISKKVRAKDLWTNADSIHEFGYHPSE